MNPSWEPIPSIDQISTVESPSIRASPCRCFFHLVPRSPRRRCSSSPMACHHNNHQLHTHKPCCCCCCYCCAPARCSSETQPSILNTTTTTVTDPLLQAIAAHLLQSAPAAPQPTNRHEYPKTQYDAHLHHHQQQKYQRQQQPRQQQPRPPQDQGLIQSLLRRIAALESTLPHLSPPPPPSATAPPPPRNPRPSRSVPPATYRVSIRDVAARTIQARFRLYLVRRSQTLRHLKHLATIRSHVAAVKSCLSDEVRMSPKALSQKATDLLLQLDSIESADRMIQEGKQSISRELVQLLGFADEISAERRRELHTESMDRAAFAEESSPRVEELAGVSPVFGEDDEESDAGSPKTRTSTCKTVKGVNFAENGEDYRVSTTFGVPFAEEEATRGRFSDGRRRTTVTDPSRRENGRVLGFSVAPEHGAEAQWGEGGGGGGRSLQTSGDETSPGGRRKAGSRPVAPGRVGGSHLLGLAAPLPVQMEPRRGDSKKKNAV